MILLLLILNIFSCSDKVKGPEEVPGEEKLGKFDEMVSSVARELKIEAYSYAIISNKDILKLSENGMSADHKVQVGDISNLFLGALVLRSSEKGSIDVNDPLSKYGINGDPGKAQIKNVLSYTSNATSQIINYNPENFSNVGQALQAATGEEIAELFRKHISRRLNLKQTSIQLNGDEFNFTSSLKDLILFSMAIDNRQLFEEENHHNQMFRPVYLETGERSPSGLGCFITISDERKLIWSAGQTPDYSTLMIKSDTDSISFIMVATSDRMNIPFDLETGDISHSPFYHAFVKTILGGEQSGIDFFSSYAAIRQSIRDEFKSGRRDAVYDELVAHLKMYNRVRNVERYDSLLVLYREFFPKDIAPEKLLTQPVSAIKGSMDYTRYKRHFTLPKDTQLSIFATGEFTSQMVMQPWEYDNVEMYFDLKHERSPNFDSNKDDRQYRFNYDFQQLTGNAPTFDNVTLVQHDVSPTRFNFEIAIPWKTLLNSDSLLPVLNQQVGFDIAIADNDGQAREGSLAWRSKLNETPWSNTSSYGTLVLAQTPGTPQDTICYAVMTSSPIAVDGQNKGEWNNVPRYPINVEFMSGISGSSDQSGWFRVQWDDANLYFFIEVEDDVKRLIEKSGDFGWITNANEDTVWMFKEESSLHAGGDSSNRYIFTEIPFAAGAYNLYYQTNQTNSPGRWSKDRPELSFYGVVVYE